MNEYAVRVHAHHPYGDAMPKEQGVTASLAAQRFSRQGYSRMRLNRNGTVTGPLSADAVRNPRSHAGPVVSAGL